MQGWPRPGRIALSRPTPGGPRWRPFESCENSVRRRLAPDRESFPCHQVTLSRVAGREVCICRAGSPQQSQSATAATPPSGTGRGAYICPYVVLREHRDASAVLLFSCCTGMLKTREARCRCRPAVVRRASCRVQTCIEDSPRSRAKQHRLATFSPLRCHGRQHRLGPGVRSASAQRSKHRSTAAGCVSLLNRWRVSQRTASPALCPLTPRGYSRTREQRAGSLASPQRAGTLGTDTRIR